MFKKYLGFKILIFENVRKNINKSPWAFFERNYGFMILYRYFKFGSGANRMDKLRRLVPSPAKFMQQRNVFGLKLLVLLIENRLTQ